MLRSDGCWLAMTMKSPQYPASLLRHGGDTRSHHGTRHTPDQGYSLDYLPNFGKIHFLEPLIYTQSSYEDHMAKDLLRL